MVLFDLIIKTIVYEGYIYFNKNLNPLEMIHLFKRIPHHLSKNNLEREYIAKYSEIFIHKEMKGFGFYMFDSK